MDASSKISVDTDENSELRSSNGLGLRGKKDGNVARDLMRVVVAVVLGDPSMAVTSLLNLIT